MRGTRLWQAAGSPIIQGRSRTHVPLWRDLVSAVFTAGVMVSLYDWIVSEPYEFAWSELVEFATAFAYGVVYGIGPAFLALLLARAFRARQAGLIAAAVGGASAIAILMYWPQAAV